MGGYSFHAHGGYSKEIYADYPQGLTDGVELLQFAVYRGISLQDWYRILNVGFRFPAVGASDYPYCRALGDCRTYVRLDQDRSFQAWARNAAQGRSFFTTGPLLLLDVNGRAPYDEADLTTLLNCLEKRTDFHRGRRFPQKQSVLDYFETAHRELTRIRQSKGQSAP